MKVMAALCLLLLPVWVLASSCEQASATSGNAGDCRVIEVGFLLANKSHGKAVRALARSFELAHPGTRIRLLAYKDEAYKEQIETWRREKAGPDIFYWQGGERLYDLVHDGAVKDVSLLWQEHALERRFPESVAALTRYQGRHYAVPFAVYQWGFYYKKSLFERLGLQVPGSWQAFLDIGMRLKDQGMQFIALGASEKWPVAAWFDYLNLRLNGPDFHAETLAGQVVFTDPRIKSVLRQIKSLRDNGMFAPGFAGYAWHEAMPMIYREMAAVTLMGNFIETDIPPHLREDIGFFPFPAMNYDIASAELFPTEVWSIASWSTQTDLAKAFLVYLSDLTAQRLLAQGLGYQPAHQAANQELPPLASAGKELLLRTETVFQYSDRDFTPSFSRHAVDVLHAFMLNPEVDAAAQALEAKRFLLQRAPQ